MYVNLIRTTLYAVVFCKRGPPLYFGTQGARVHVRVRLTRGTLAARGARVAVDAICVTARRAHRARVLPAQADRSQGDTKNS